MDRRDTILLITEKIKALEPENASIFIDYLLLQEMTKAELIRMALGPDLLIQEFCQKAKSELGYLPSTGSSLNPNARPFNTNDQSLSQSSGRNQFLNFSRIPNIRLSPSLIRDNPNSNSGLFHDGSSQFPFHNNNNLFPNLQTRSLSANHARLESEQHRYWFLPNGFGTPGGFLSPNEEIAQPQQQRMIAARGSPMSNIQGSGQFGVEGAYVSPSENIAQPQQQRMIAARGSLMSNIQGSGQFQVEGGISPGSHEREGIIKPRKIFFTFPPESSFSEEDVSTYFSKFGSVVDVRIPANQEPRVYGFVTFAKAKTVKTILDQENPHYICNSSVKVKPCIEKAKDLQNSN